MDSNRFCNDPGCKDEFDKEAPRKHSEFTVSQGSLVKTFAQNYGDMLDAIGARHSGLGIGLCRKQGKKPEKLYGESGICETEDRGKDPDKPQARIPEADKKQVEPDQEKVDKAQQKGEKVTVVSDPVDFSLRDPRTREPVKIEPTDDPKTGEKNIAHTFEEPVRLQLPNGNEKLTTLLLFVCFPAFSFVFKLL